MSSSSIPIPAGRLALTATKGVFRFVGGKISKNNPVTLKTPTAVIGIRGGIALVNVQPSGATQATFLFGDQMTVAAAGVTQVATRPGFAITATAADEAPSAPTPAPPALLTAALNSLERSAPPSQEEGPQSGDQQQGTQSGASQQQGGQQQGQVRRSACADRSRCRRDQPRSAGFPTGTTGAGVAHCGGVRPTSACGDRRGCGGTATGRHA